MHEIIYKYLPIERITYLNDELLRITQPSDLNDPYECIPILPTIEESIEIFNEQVKKKISIFKGNAKQKEKYQRELVKKYQRDVDKMRSGAPNNLKIQYLAKGLEKLNNNFGLLSFSRRWNSSLMWAHYTKSHSGICIGFDYSNRFFQDYIPENDDPYRVFDIVKYSDERVKVPTQNSVDEVNLKIMFTKSKDWEYEQELRFLVSLGFASKKIFHKPFDIHLLKVPHQLIKEIIVGVKTSPEEVQKIKEFCSKKSIPLYQTKISESKFDMERTQL